MDIRKFTKEENKATYLTVFEFLSFENNKNKAPIVGKRISDDRIGKSINIKLKRLIIQKNLLIS